MHEEDAESEERINIMTLGSMTVGKSSFILKYTENNFQEIYLATVGIDFKVKTLIIKDKQYKLFFYDTTGQEKYKSISLNVIKTAHGVVLMYDITNKSSFESIPDWISSIKEAKGDNFPMILLGNKKDLEKERQISIKEGEQLADENDIEFFETSNKEGTNINEAGLCIVNKILDKRKKDILDYNSSQTSTKLRSGARNVNQNSSKKCYF